MSEYDHKSLESKIDLASKLLSLAFKLGVLVGGACLLFYCYHLNYFPVGLSIGDGFLFILLAASFGIVYGLFVISLTGLGLWLTPILRPIQKLGFSIRKRFTKRRLGEPLKLVSPDLNAVFFGIFGILFIVAISHVEPSAIWTLPVTSFFLAIIFSAYQEMSSKLTDLLKTEDAKIQPATTDLSKPTLNKERLRRARGFSLIALFVTPLFVGGVSGIILEGGMRFANIRKGNSYVLLRAPYSTFVPDQLQAKQSPSAPDFTTFEGVEVMFSGIGQRSIIEFNYKNKIQRLEVPNESIIVIPR